MNVKTEGFTPHEKFVVTNKDWRLAYACTDAGRHGSVTSEITSTCHYRIQYSAGKLSDYSGNFHMKSAGAPELWGYLTSPTGPYRKIWEFAGVPQLIGESSDKIAGFTLDNKIFEFPCYPLVYSFLINTRIPGEHQNHCRTFGYLVNKGYDPSYSFLLAKHITWDKKGLMTGPGYWTGSHECLIEKKWPDIAEPYYIDVKRWRDGEPHDVKQQNVMASSLFRLGGVKNGTPMMQNLAWGAYATEVKTSFTKIKVIPEDQEQKMFEDFKQLINLRYR